MGTPFLGEIKVISWNFAPAGWAFCNGQFLPINQNQALFSLFGTTYGGNGQTNFALPDLRGRVPMHFGAGFTQGERSGSEFVTLSQTQMPQHLHFAQGTAVAATTNNPSGALLGAVSSSLYIAPTNLTSLQPTQISNYGGSQPHENRSPYLVLNFIVALQGIFPSQS